MKYSPLQIILGTLLALMLFYAALEITKAMALSTYTGTLESQLAEQRKTIEILAETTARNDADDATNILVKDCAPADRESFDVLLRQLDSGLSNQDLAELDRLFGRCGTYYADRKEIMVSRLEREVQFYENILNQLSSLTGEDESEEAMLASWLQLVSLERQQADHFTNLVSSQDMIISALLEGKSQQSEEITEILGVVNESQENLRLANTQAASIRNELIPQ